MRYSDIINNSFLNTNTDTYFITEIEELYRHHKYQVYSPVLVDKNKDENNNIISNNIYVSTYMFVSESNDLDEILNELNKRLIFMSHIFTVKIPYVDWNSRTIIKGTEIIYRGVYDLKGTRILDYRKEKLKSINEFVRED